MQRHVHFKGDTQSFLSGIEYRTTGQVIDGVGACIDVVSIVICSLFASVDIIGHTCPLGRITGSLQITGQSAYCAAGYISHSSAETNGIGTDNPVFAALIA